MSIDAANSLNPYSTGNEVVGLHGRPQKPKKRSLNPYSTGNEVVGNRDKPLLYSCLGGLNPYSTGNEVVGKTSRGIFSKNRKS